MKSFLPKCIGISIIILSVGFFIRSIQPAYAGKNSEYENTSDKPSKILWVNIDSIDANYKPFTELSSKAGGGLDSLMKEYQRRLINVQQRYNDLQQKAQAGVISADDAQKEEDAINTEANEVQRMEEEINNMQNDAMEKNKAITDDITLFLKGYAKRKKADYILGVGPTSNVLYSNDDFDVTQEVLNELNKRYEQKQKGGK